MGVGLGGPIQETDVMKILYFAWVRQKIGQSEQQIDLPDGVTTAAQLADYLQSLSHGHQHALDDRESLCVAVNQTFSTWDTPVGNEDEVAFFPPVTGG